MRAKGLWGLIPLLLVACGGEDTNDGGNGNGKDASTGGVDAGVGGSTGGLGGSSASGGLGGSSASGGAGGSSGAAASGGTGGISGAGGASGAGGVGGSGGLAGTGGFGGTLDCAPYVNVTEQDACVAFGDGLCNPLAQCAPIFFSYMAVTGAADCSARMQLACHQILNAPGSNIQPALFAAYGALLATQTCDTNPSNEFEPPQNVTPECGDYGDFVDGKQCYGGGQCAGAQCTIDDDQVCGVCSHGTAGTPCFEDDDCDDDFYCTPASVCAGRAVIGQPCTTAKCVQGAFCNAAKQCVAQGNVGAPCTDAGACLDSLVCGVNGQCKVPTKGKVGASCNPLESGSCDSNFDLYCGPGQICVQHVPPAPGQPCGIYAGDAGLVVELACSGGAWCIVPPNGNGKGTCMSAAADGAVCNQSTGPRCKINADCIAGHCVVADATTCPPN